jgi:hypothetical protein
VSNAARYNEVVNKLEEYVAVHICDQATVAASAMEDLKAPTFNKPNRTVRVYWADGGQATKTNNKRNADATTNNVPKLGD